MVALLCMVYGVFHFVRPWMINLLRYKAYRDMTINLSISDDKLYLTDGQNEFVFNFADLYKVVKRSDYWLIKLAPMQFLTVPASRLSPDERDYLQKNLIDRLQSRQVLDYTLA